VLFFCYAITRMLFSPSSTNATKKEPYTMFKSQEFSLINYDCLPFQRQNYFLKCYPFTKMLLLSNWPSPPTNRGPLAPLRLVFNIKKFSYFSTRIVRTATVFFWILDSFVYHMYFTCDKKAIQNFPCPLVSSEKRWHGLHQPTSSFLHI